MTKYAAYPTLFKRGSTNVANVTNIGGPGLGLDTEDVTSLDQTTAWEEHVATILRSGEVSLDLVFDPQSATHTASAGGLLYDMTQRTATQAYSILFPNAVTWTFYAFVTGFEPSAPVDGALTVACKLKLTGAPTLA